MSEPVNLAFAFNLPPAQALAYFRAKGYRVNPDGWAAVEAAANRKAFTVARVASLDLLQDIKTAMDGALADGTTFREFQQKLMPKMKALGWWGKDENGVQLGSPHRLATIFRTNVQTSYMEGRWQGLMDNVDNRPWIEYVAILDSRTRPGHRALSGKVFRYDDPFWRTMRPPLGWNCFLPDTNVSGAIEYGLKSFYSGKAFEITTRSGISLSITANHPIYTRRGWLRADQIAKGDHLIRNTGRINGVCEAPALIDNEHFPSAAEKLFQSMLAHGLRVVDVPSLKLNENLDGRNGEIHITAANRHLMDDWDASISQFLQNWEFILTSNGIPVGQKEPGRPPAVYPGVVDAVDLQDSLDVGLRVAKRLGNADARQVGVFIKIANDWLDSIISGSGGNPGFSALPFDSGPILLDGQPLDGLSFRSATDGDPSLLKHPLHGLPATTSHFRDLLHACAGLVEIDEVVNVREFDFSGHVYDFQTETGVIFAENIMVHNCRCRIRALNDRDLERRGITPDQGEGNLKQYTPEAQGYRQPQAGYVDPRTGTETRTDIGWGYDRLEGWTPPAARYDPILQELLLMILNTETSGNDPQD